MAHELNYNERKGTYSFASHAEVAWHGLGQVVPAAMTAAEAIQQANLDYQVVKEKIYTKSPVNDDVEVCGYWATIRTDSNDVLGVVRSRYEVVQNKDAFLFFDSIVDEGEAIYETAGALGKGERIFLLAKLPEDFRIGGEKINRYILLYNSHDGTSSIVAGLTNVRVVCNNTLQAALRGISNKVLIAHTQGAKERLKEASRVMGISSEYTNAIKDVFNRMVDTKMSEQQYVDYYTKIFKTDYVLTEGEQKEDSTRLKNMVNSTMHFALTHPTQTSAEAYGTLWGAYNAISGYYNYIKDFKSPEEKFKSTFFGNAEKKMLKSFDIAQKMLA